MRAVRPLTTSAESVEILAEKAALEALRRQSADLARAVSLLSIASEPAVIETALALAGTLHDGLSALLPPVVPVTSEATKPAKKSR